MAEDDRELAGGPEPGSAAPQRAGRSRPTMQDVADRVGLSRQLVSIVLRGVEGASEESRERVLAAAQEIGYYPDRAAQLLRQRRSGQIGVLFSMQQPFEVDVVDCLYEEAAKVGFGLVLGTTGTGRSEREAFSELMQQRIEGLIVLSAGSEDGRVSNPPRGMPVVLLGGPVSDGACDEVHVENRHGLSLAVEHLVELGHERIFFAGPTQGVNVEDRILGYESTMRKHGLESGMGHLPCDITEEGGYLAALEYLRCDPHPTALVCGNDRCASGLLDTLLRAGVRVPEDLSVVGFDNSSVARLPYVQMTSVSPDPSRMAELAVRAVRERLEDPAHGTWLRTVPTTLVVRETSGPAPAG